tara:strand:+ start:120 stop:482 length:363 start_codon:yes stop_codon:yes gene_type:complete
MIEYDISVPSEENRFFNFNINKEYEWDTSNAPFEFTTIDCEGTELNYPLDSVDLEVKIFLNGCMVLELDPSEIKKGVVVGVDDNKAYIQTVNFDLRLGLYDYVVYFKDTSSVIKGKLKIF